MKQQFDNNENSKEEEVKSEDKLEGNKELSQKSEEVNEEEDISKAAKDELTIDIIMKGVIIDNRHANEKLIKALTKYIELYDPNNIESILKMNQLNK